MLSGPKYIPWWRINFTDEDIDKVAESIRQENISMGKVTEEFEQLMAKALEVPYVVASSSGSVALLMTLMALEIKHGDEVIIPNRTWIATAHAPMMLGAKSVIVDVLPDRPVMDTSLIKEKINSRTRAIIPVPLCGCSVNMEEVWKIAKDHNLFVVEDAAQGLFSKYQGKFIGTQSDAGCFSMAISKLVSTGQGGFVATRKKRLYEQMRLIRTHGVENVNAASPFLRMGYNFRFTDLHASLGLVQLANVSGRIENIKKIYCKYRDALKEIDWIQLIPVHIEEGEIPLYVEVLLEEREIFMKYLASKNIQTRAIYPDLDSAKHLNCREDYPNAAVFGKQGLVLPCGPDQPIENIDVVISTLKKFGDQTVY